MDEKILIKSEFDKKIRTILFAIAGISIIFSSLVFILFAVCKSGLKYSSWTDRYYYTYDNLYESAFDFDDFTNVFHFIIFIFACLGVIVCVTTLIIYFIRSKCEITITEKNVRGRTLFGKEVVLPLYMISAYSTGKLLSTISVATSSGITKFSLVGNYKEIGKVLSEKINERQESTATAAAATSAPAPQSSSMDELKKLKELLDAGIITEEEFAAKKKQLLGL